MPDELSWFVISNGPEGVTLACAFQESDLNDPADWIGTVTIPRKNLVKWAQRRMREEK